MLSSSTVLADCINNIDNKNNKKKQNYALIQGHSLALLSSVPVAFFCLPNELGDGADVEETVLLAVVEAASRDLALILAA